MTLRHALALAFLVGFGAAAAGAGVPAARFAQTTGDEPHYLLTARSLAEDGDLDLRDELAADRYRDFHAADLDPQAKPLDDGSLVAPHDPLLPALLAGPLAAGGWLAAKLVLALLAGALASLLVWTAVRRLGVPVRHALTAVLLFAASAPLAVYGTQVYPELPAALAVTAAAAGLGAPVAVIALPWLSVKYVVVAAVLGVLTLRRRWWLLGVYAGAAVVFVVAHKLWYGGWTPYAAGDHFVGGELTAVGHDPNYVGRSRRLLGLLVDREFGLAAWQPAWLLVVPALAAVLVRRPPWWKTVALPLAAGWLVATFVALTMHGWWFPGRQLVVVLPLAVLAIAWWAQEHSRLLTGLAAIGVATYAFLVFEGYWGGVTWVVDFYETDNPWYLVWRHALPSFADETARTWLLAGAWALALAAYAYTVTLRACGRSDTRAPRCTTSVDGRWATRRMSPTRTR